VQRTWTKILIILGLMAACKNADSSKPNGAADDVAGASVAGNMCDRVGGIVGDQGICQCENGVAAFKLLGQTCAQLLSRQETACTSLGGQILYDDAKCRCFPNYDPVSAGASCPTRYPAVVALDREDEKQMRGACVILERQTGKPHDTCFEDVDLDGCERSFQVAFNQVKQDQYEMMFFPQKGCDKAKAIATLPTQIP